VHAQTARQAQYVCEVETLRGHLEACLQELQRERRTALELRSACEALHEQAAFDRCGPGGWAQGARMLL